eukprot:1406448-Prymnesium_polylepis.2
MTRGAWPPLLQCVRTDRARPSPSLQGGQKDGERALRGAGPVPAAAGRLCGAQGRHADGETTRHMPAPSAHRAPHVTHRTSRTARHAPHAAPPPAPSWARGRVAQSAEVSAPPRSQVVRDMRVFKHMGTLTKAGQW